MNGIKLIPITASENIIPNKIEKNMLIANEKLNEFKKICMVFIGSVYRFSPQIVDIYAMCFD